eukprot:1859420-Lingulodinium_polyedra.AAC.1
MGMPCLPDLVIPGPLAKVCQPWPDIMQKLSQTTVPEDAMRGVIGNALHPAVCGAVVLALLGCMCDPSVDQTLGKEDGSGGS